MNRFWLALRTFWRTLTEADFAARVEPLFSRQPTGPDLRILAVLQRDGRLVDFLEEDIDAYTDAQIGAAVRDIHRGCRKALREYLTIEPVLTGRRRVRSTSRPTSTRPPIRLIGNVDGSPPFNGVLKHHGWRVTVGPSAGLAGRPRRLVGRSPRPKSRSPDPDRRDFRFERPRMSRFVVGIDLGTTNCALAYAATGEERPRTPRRHRPRSRSSRFRRSSA